MSGSPSPAVPPHVLRRSCAVWPTGVAVVTSVDRQNAPAGTAIGLVRLAQRHERPPLLFIDGELRNSGFQAAQIA